MNRHPDGVLFALGYCLALAVSLAGCTPEQSSLTQGKVSLQFEKISDSDLTVILGNGLDHSIFVRGQRIPFLPIRMFLTDTRISCDTPQGLRGALFGFTEAKPKYIEVSPGERVKLVIPSTFPQQYKGSQCNVEVILKDGTAAGPAEFQS